MPALKSIINRSTSHRVVQYSSAPELNLFAAGGAAETASCWANLPQELLREVLVRIEESESSWPPRKNVVACAGVCRSWRHITKDLVKVPELSGKITFPISVKQVAFLCYFVFVLILSFCELIMIGVYGFDFVF